MFIIQSIAIKEGQDKTSEAEIFQILYIILYWLIYLLSWIVIPLAQEYEAAGYFTMKERFKKAVRRNIYSYLFFAMIGVAFVIYLVVNKKLTG